MPTYEYECRSCKYRFEEFQSITDEPIKKCPKCGKAVRRLFGGGMGIIFKGSGFYTTDYKRSSAVSSSSAGSGDNGSSKSKESKTETKSTSSESKNTSGQSSGD
jgi:putative FmdB family regulatory protein